MAGSAWRSAASMLHGRPVFSEHPSVLVTDDRYGTSLRGATVSRASHQRRSHGLDRHELATALLTPAIRECIAGIPRYLSEGADLQFVDGLCGDSARLVGMLEKEIPGLPRHKGNSPDPPSAGRHDFLERVITAINALLQGKFQCVLVAAVDSLCFLPVLQQLMERDRLLSGANPEGIIPGEAAGAIILERERHARKRGAPIYAGIASWGRGNDPAPRSSGKPSTAQGLSMAFSQALAGGGRNAAAPAHVVADLNGERQRAIEWAMTEVRIFGDTPAGAPDLWLPAFTAGDCGAATGAVQAVFSAAFLSKGRSNGSSVALFSSDDSGESRVVCLEPGDYQDRHALNRWRRERMENGKAKW